MRSAICLNSSSVSSSPAFSLAMMASKAAQGSGALFGSGGRECRLNRDRTWAVVCG